MALPNPFAKEIFIRLAGGDALISTVKYGPLYSKTKEFKVDSVGSEVTFPQDAPVRAKHLVPPLTIPPRRGE